MVWFGTVWYNMAWYGMAWYGIKWNVMVSKAEYGICMKGIKGLYFQAAAEDYCTSAVICFCFGASVGSDWWKNSPPRNHYHFFWGIIETACGLWTLRNWSKNISRERENRQSQSVRFFPTRFVWSPGLEHVFPMEVIFGTKSIIITAHENIHRAVILFFCLMAFYWVVWIY